MAALNRAVLQGLDAGAVKLPVAELAFVTVTIGALVSAFNEFPLDKIAAEYFFLRTGIGALAVKSPIHELAFIPGTVLTLQRALRNRAALEPAGVSVTG